MNDITKVDDAHAIMERVLMSGDLNKLTPQERVMYYNSVCTSIGVNPLTRPFDYLNLNGKLTLYARKDCTDQLRKINNVSIEKIEREISQGLCMVTVYAKDKSGKMDSDVGAVFVEGLKGEALANAIMKATTKAKRRVTLSISGLGMLDETEVDSIPADNYYDPSRDTKRRPALEANAKLAPVDSPERDQLIENLEDAASFGSESLEKAWTSLSKDQRKLVGKDEMDRIKKIPEAL